MNPIGKLVDEHRNILKGIDLLEKAADKLDGGEEIPSDFFSKVVDFIRNYADKYHHAKEENILFVRMEKAGFPREEGPVGVMLAEHDQGRDYVSNLENANKRYAGGDKSAVSEIVENARGYIHLLRQHINKENNILYPMAENALSQTDIESMQHEFEKVEQGKSGVEQKYIAMLKELQSYLAEPGG